MKDMITKSFSEVFDLSLGRTPSRGNNLYWNGIHPWVSIADMSNVKYISQTKEKITDKALSDTHIPIVKKGTVIMSFKLTIGKVCITDCDIYTNEAIMAFTPKPQYKILPEFLFYYLMYYKWDKSNEVVLGCTLNKKSISQSLLSYPSSLAEQQRIVEILDAGFAKIDALRANATKSLQAAKDLFQSALKQELQPKEGWVKSRLNDLYDVRDGTHDSPRYCPEGYPLVTSKNLKNGIIDISNVKFISYKDYIKINERSKVNIGDVLFAMIGTIGNPTLVAEEPNYAIKNIALFKVPQQQSGALLKYILSSNVILREMHKKAKGSNQPFVSLGFLRNFKISIPISLAEQTRIVSRLDQLNERCKTLQENYDRTITLCEDLKQALLRKAFNGEL